MVAEDESCALEVAGCLLRLRSVQRGLAGELLDILYYLAFQYRTIRGKG
jgi:hypothetical protein